MRKQEKIEYINNIYYKFIDAQNHGHGNNWWYPIKNVIAYNVKMNAFADTDELRTHLTQRQNEYYSDNDLAEYLWQDLEDEARFFVDDLKSEYDLVSDVYFAGRSGGWLEVEYINELEDVDEDTDNEDLKYYYAKAQELEEEEAKVRQAIEEAHQNLNNYIDSDEYYKHIVENMLDDEEIAEIYKSKIKHITNKLK